MVLAGKEPAAGLAIVLSLAAPAMIRIFMQDDTIVTAGVPMLRMQQLGMVFAAVIVLASGLFGCFGILLAQAISDVLTAVLAICLFRRGIYKEIA